VTSDIRNWALLITFFRVHIRIQFSFNCARVYGSDDVLQRQLCFRQIVGKQWRQLLFESLHVGNQPTHLRLRERRRTHELDYRLNATVGRCEQHSALLTLLERMSTHAKIDELANCGLANASTRRSNRRLSRGAALCALVVVAAVLAANPHATTSIRHASICFNTSSP
jgi:hypothetical protein